MLNDMSKYVPKKTNQGQCHAHDNRGEDEIEGGDLQHVAVRVRVCVDILILSRHVQRFGTIILVSILEKKAEINRAALTEEAAVVNNAAVLGIICFLPALRT